MYTPTDIEIERRNRIRVLLASYAYEYLSEIIMSDHEFDRLCLKIRPEIETGHKVCDEFFKNEFSPSTGSWIYDFPKEELHKLNVLYKKIKKT